MPRGSKANFQCNGTPSPTVWSVPRAPPNNATPSARGFRSPKKPWDGRETRWRVVRVGGTLDFRSPGWTYARRPGGGGGGGGGGGCDDGDWRRAVAFEFPAPVAVTAMGWVPSPTRGPVPASRARAAEPSRRSRIPPDRRRAYTP